MAEKKNEKPFKAVGDRLKFLREQWQQTIREVSDTLEIDEGTLRSIESGQTLPDIDVLDMLISHFLLTDDQADDLRQLVDNTLGKKAPDLGLLPMGLDENLAKQIVMLMPSDNKVVYTDGMNANVNDHGVILQFMQQTPSSQQPAVVSRVGMSREHAEKIINVLKHTLDEYDRNKKQKLLPGPDNQKDSNKQ